MDIAFGVAWQLLTWGACNAQQQLIGQGAGSDIGRGKHVAVPTNGK